ncbi:hypothetical protein [Bradyrhizobium ottawaense]|uniref:hypothetical protein n=1 Tax=Bradyrhizobium ottawaense TaxID=931866 RepID=UPI0030C7788C
MSIGVFCAVSQGEYPLLRHTLRPFIESEHTRSILILHTGPRPHPDFQSLASEFPVVTELHSNFGEGYEVSVAQGGYDQLGARNFAIEHVEESGADWLIQFDADEFITRAGIDEIVRTPEIYDLVLFSYYTLVSRAAYWFEDRIARSVNGTILNDPHPLIWRRCLEKRTELCGNSAKLYVNHTRHCSVSFHNHPRWRVRALDAPYHFHFHCLLGKRNADLRQRFKEFEAPLPADLLRCLDSMAAENLIRIG